MHGLAVVVVIMVVMDVAMRRRRWAPLAAGGCATRPSLGTVLVLVLLGAWLAAVDGMVSQCSACEAVAAELEARVTAEAEKGLRSLDIDMMGRINPQGERIGKKIPYRVSELRAFELIEGLCSEVGQAYQLNKVRCSGRATACHRAPGCYVYCCARCIGSAASWRRRQLIISDLIACPERPPAWCAASDPAPCPRAPLHHRSSQKSGSGQTGCRIQR